MYKLGTLPAHKDLMKMMIFMPRTERHLCARTGDDMIHFPLDFSVK